VLFWSSVPILVAVYDLHLGVAFALSSLQCLTLPLVVRTPRAAVLVQLASLVFISFLTRASSDEFWPVPIPNLVALTVVLIVLGLRESWYVSVAAWWLGFLTMTLTVVVNVGDLFAQSDWRENMLVSITVTLGALAASIAVGQRRRMRDILASARRDVELEQARRATVEERARIARELHDVVAHSMSIVHIQAESAGFRVKDLGAARDEFEGIARSARAALSEMRQLLGALRPVDTAVDYAPQPTIADIPALVAGAERVGGLVAFTSGVRPGTGGPIVELTAYRIVQEALSNAVRHAPRAAVDVELGHAPSAITVRVVNAAPPVAPAPAPAPRPAGTARGEHGGHGLRGMRERVALLGGEIVQRPTDDGGYLIQATLPIQDGLEAS
jgi:signal transduction histidine kinase